MADRNTRRRGMRAAQKKCAHVFTLEHSRAGYLTGRYICILCGLTHRVNSDPDPNRRSSR